MQSKMLLFEGDKKVIGTEVGVIVFYSFIIHLWVYLF